MNDIWHVSDRQETRDRPHSTAAQRSTVCRSSRNDAITDLSRASPAPRSKAIISGTCNRLKISIELRFPPLSVVMKAVLIF